MQLLKHYKTKLLNLLYTATADIRYYLNLGDHIALVYGILVYLYLLAALIVIAPILLIGFLYGVVLGGYRANYKLNSKKYRKL